MIATKAKLHNLKVFNFSIIATSPYNLLISFPSIIIWQENLTEKWNNYAGLSTLVTETNSNARIPKMRNAMEHYFDISPKWSISSQITASFN